METDRPALHCFVAYPITSELFTEPALVSLDVAYEMREKGYVVVGPDPQDEIDLASFERSQRVTKKWFEAS